jgi:hypothetical protein
MFFLFVKYICQCMCLFKQITPINYWLVILSGSRDSWLVDWLGFGPNKLRLHTQQGQEICLFTKISYLALGPTQAHSEWVPGAFPLQVKCPWCEVDHSSPCGAVVTNEWKYASTPTICLHDIYRKNFINTFSVVSYICITLDFIIYFQMSPLSFCTLAFTSWIKNWIFGMHSPSTKDIWSRFLLQFSM